MRASTRIVSAAALALMGAAATAWAQPPAPAAGAAASQDPAQLVQSAAEGLLKDLEANRATYRKDPSQVRALVDKHLLPHFDIEYSARLVLGRHNRDATPEQR